MNKSIIITAGGKGLRMKTDIPKQFILINGLPILMQTVQTFYEYDPSIEIIIVLPENQIEYWTRICGKFNFSIKHIVVAGGKERFHSVKNGLTKATGAIIGVHDAVRPFVAIDVIKNCFDKAAKFDAVIPVVDSVESLRYVDETGSKSVDRAAYKKVQTPQCFKADTLKKAYQLDYDPLFTDDASIVEKLGIKIHLVKGNSENIKITSPLDLKLAKQIQNNE